MPANSKPYSAPAASVVANQPWRDSRPVWRRSWAGRSMVAVAELLLRKVSAVPPVPMRHSVQVGRQRSPCGPNASGELVDPQHHVVAVAVGVHAVEHVARVDVDPADLVAGPPSGMTPMRHGPYSVPVERDRRGTGWTGVEIEQTGPTQKDVTVGDGEVVDHRGRGRRHRARHEAAVGVGHVVGEVGAQRTRSRRSACARWRDRSSGGRSSRSASSPPKSYGPTVERSSGDELVGQADLARGQELAAVMDDRHVALVVWPCRARPRR